MGSYIQSWLSPAVDSMLVNKNPIGKQSKSIHVARLDTCYERCVAALLLFPSSRWIKMVQNSFPVIHGSQLKQKLLDFWAFGKKREREKERQLRVCNKPLLSCGLSTEIAINPGEKKKERKKLFTLNYANEWVHEVEAWGFSTPHLSVSSQTWDVTLLSGVKGKVIEVEINGTFPGGL